jgi:hypothetical protein
MSERAVGIIRASQGDDGKESLREQREEIPRLLCELLETDLESVGEYGSGKQIVILDLGIHTGFSTYSRNPNEYNGELLDQNDDIQNLLQDLKNGEFAYIGARDKNRISRDDFFSEIKRAATVFGDADFVLWKDDNDVDSMGSSVEHVIARKKKQQEIEESIRMLRNKMERGEPVGRPPYGYKYNTDKTALLPDLPDFEKALQVLALLDDDDWTWADIEEETGVNPGTMTSIRDRKAEYVADAREHDIDLPDGLDELAAE